MSFRSEHAKLIWDKLHTVLIPDLLTQQPEYLRIFGNHTTGDKEADTGLSDIFITVMIPVARILEYFEDGIEVQIPSRETMIEIHKDIELYLLEWESRIKYDINLNVEKNKQMILGLERLSKYIYQKAKPNELIDNLFMAKKIGITSPMDMIKDKQQEKVKPDYQGISSLVRSKTAKPTGRF